MYRHWRDISRQGKVVGEKQYPDLVIKFCLTVKSVYGLKLRQCTGFISSIFGLMGLSELAVANYSTLCRRSSTLRVKVSHRPLGQGLHIAVDSTGLKVLGEGEWKFRKHGGSKRRTWRNLADAAPSRCGRGNPRNYQRSSHGCVLTDNSVDDAQMISELLGGVEGQVFYGDGAYDKKKARKVVAKMGAKAIVPPPKNAVRSKGHIPGMAERDEAIDRIAQIGRKEWKQEMGYHKRSLSEVAMHRYKGSIVNTLSTRKFENQVTEVRTGCHILNVFRGCGMPYAVKT